MKTCKHLFCLKAAVLSCDGISNTKIIPCLNFVYLSAFKERFVGEKARKRLLVHCTEGVLVSHGGLGAVFKSICFLQRIEEFSQLA